jgi:hypothetical protein
VAGVGASLSSAAAGTVQKNGKKWKKRPFISLNRSDRSTLLTSSDSELDSLSRSCLKCPDQKKRPYQKKKKKRKKDKIAQQACIPFPTHCLLLNLNKPLLALQRISQLGIWSITVKKIKKKKKKKNTL